MLSATYYNDHVAIKHVTKTPWLWLNPVDYREEIITLYFRDSQTKDNIERFMKHEKLEEVKRDEFLNIEGVEPYMLCFNVSHSKRHYPLRYNNNEAQIHFKNDDYATVKEHMERNPPLSDHQFIYTHLLRVMEREEFLNVCAQSMNLSRRLYAYLQHYIVHETDTHEKMVDLYTLYYYYVKLGYWYADFHIHFRYDKGWCYISFSDKDVYQYKIEDNVKARELRDLLSASCFDT